MILKLTHGYFFVLHHHIGTCSYSMLFAVPTHLSKLMKPLVLSNAANTVLIFIHLQLYSLYYTTTDAFSNCGHSNAFSTHTYLTVEF